MAEWEPHQCLNMEMNEGLPAAVWALYAMTSLTLNRL
jgi:hypothetical protein